MNEKKVELGNEARENLLVGISKLYDAVKCTLGPMGKNVIIKRNEMAPVHITKDGVTVVRDIVLLDPMQDLGAQIVKEAAMKTADKAGDGTTTATILASHIISKGIMNVKNGANPVKMKNGITEAAKLAVEYVAVRSVEVKANADEICNIATISANNDPEIGKLIAEGMSKVKEEGTIAVENSKTSETTIEVVEGMKLDKGYVSHYFMTEPEKMQAELIEPYILCCDQPLSNMQEIIPMLDTIAKSNASVVIFAHEIEGEALSAMILNKIKGALKVVAIKAPGHGDIRKEIMRDIAIVCGGTITEPDAGVTLDNVTLGRAAKVIVTKDSTVIIGGAGTPESIQKRAAEIRAMMETCTFDHEKKQHKLRLARISGGVAVMYIGAGSEIEMKEKKDRVDDALSATKAAIEEGIIPGGGIMYMQAAAHIRKSMAEHEYDEDYALGMKIMCGALYMPFQIIMENAGLSHEVIYAGIFKKNEGNYGYDAKGNQYGDMLKLGIIDPAKVARVAIETASSIACTFITTECVIVPERIMPTK